MTWVGFFLLFVLQYVQSGGKGLSIEFEAHEVRHDVLFTYCKKGNASSLLVCFIYPNFSTDATNLLCLQDELHFLTSLCSACNRSQMLLAFIIDHPTIVIILNNVSVPTFVTNSYLRNIHKSEKNVTLFRRILSEENTLFHYFSTLKQPEICYMRWNINLMNSCDLQALFSISTMINKISHLQFLGEQFCCPDRKQSTAKLTEMFFKKIQFYRLIRECRTKIHIDSSKRQRRSKRTPTNKLVASPGNNPLASLTTNNPMASLAINKPVTSPKGKQVTSHPVPQEINTRLNLTENQKWLKKNAIRWKLQREAQIAYLCVVFIICLMLFCMWYLRGFHCRNTIKRTPSIHEGAHLLTVKEVLFRKACYLPMFNRDDGLEEVFVHDCGNDP